MRVYLLILGYLALAISVKGEYLWTEIDGTYEGLVEVGAYNLDGCLVQCLYLEHCCIASFDEKKRQCLIQMKYGVKLMPKPRNCSARTFKFPRDKLFNGDVCWKKYPGKRIKLLTNIPFDPRNLCMIYCIGCRVCFAFAYDTSTSPSCWVQLDTKALVVNDKSLMSSNTSVSYQMDKACLFSIKPLPEY